MKVRLNRRVNIKIRRLSIINNKKETSNSSVVLNGEIAATKNSHRPQTVYGSFIYMGRKGAVQAPSGRELSAKLAEGERATMKLICVQSHVGSFHR